MFAKDAAERVVACQECLAAETAYPSRPEINNLKMLCNLFAPARETVIKPAKG